MAFDVIDASCFIKFHPTKRLLPLRQDATFLLFSLALYRAAFAAIQSNIITHISLRFRALVLLSYYDTNSFRIMVYNAPLEIIRHAEDVR